MLLSVFSDSASAVLLEALDSARQWKVERVEFVGNEKFSHDQLGAVFLTKARPWYQVWSDKPAFDSATFAGDLEKLQRFYESEGYYNAGVAYDLTVDSERELIIARITVNEGRPTLISEIDVGVARGE